MWFLEFITTNVRRYFGSQVFDLEQCIMAKKAGVAKPKPQDNGELFSVVCQHERDTKNASVFREEVAEGTAEGILGKPAGAVYVLMPYLKGKSRLTVTALEGQGSDEHVLDSEDSIQVPFKFFGDTKGALRYKEVERPGQRDVIGNFYIRKTVLGEGATPPEFLLVNVEG